MLDQIILTYVFAFVLLRARHVLLEIRAGRGFSADDDLRFLLTTGELGEGCRAIANTSGLDDG